MSLHSGILPEKLPIQVAQPYLPDTEAMLTDLRLVLESGRLMEGPFAQRFEEAFRRRIGTAHAVAVNSCTTALEIILRYLDVSGREVVVPTNTFLATANAVLYAGGTPVFADINPQTLCLSPEDLARRLTPNTRAVILVHLAGLITPDLEAIQTLCRLRGVTLIEDCAHALGSARAGRGAGALSFAGAFSFYPTKLITTGNGGMITTDDATLAAFARSARVHGRDSASGEIEHLGNDWFMDELSAVLGVHQLARLDQIVDRRNEIAARYHRLLADVPALTWIPSPADSVNSTYKIPVLVAPDIGMAALKARCQQRYDLELESLYDPPCHLQPVYRRLFGYGPGLCPVAEALLPRMICLPVHMGLSDAQVDWVAQALRQELAGA